jgi:DNA-directed RNA polymerase specialized sigma24 family protein
MGGIDERRKNVLSDRKLHDAIRVVARQRGMPQHDIDEILDAVILDAMDDPKLPLDAPEETKAYLCTLARNKSIDEVRKRGRRTKHQAPAEEGEAVAAPGSAEGNRDAERLVREGMTRFPRTFSWFWRTSMQGESHVAIAAELDVSPGHVRHEVHRVRMGMQLLAAAGIVVLVITGASAWRGGAFFHQDHGVAHPYPGPDPSAPTSAPSAVPLTAEQQKHVEELRARGHAAALKKDWKLCWEAYFEAEHLDKDTPQAALDEATRCKEELDKRDAGAR